MRYLLVEDDISIAKLTTKALQSEGFAIDHTSEGLLALKWAHINEYDGMILDWKLPDIDGLSVINGLREKGKTFPIVMLTGNTDSENAFRALAAGADDFVRKPFSFKELIARLRAIHRRRPHLEAAVLELEDLRLDSQQHMVSRNGNLVYLSNKEFAILEFFLQNKETVVSRADILEHVWDQNADPFTNTVDVHIRNLRKKIDQGFHPPLIQTVHGKGYKLSRFPVRKQSKLTFK